MEKKTHKQFEVLIDSMGESGFGVGRIDGVCVFVSDALPSETVKTLIVKDKKSYCEGELIEILNASKYRVEPVCPVFDQCGGCDLLHLSYEKQLEYKQDKVFNNIKRIGGLKDVFVSDIIGAENPLYYRNKGKFYFAKEKGKTIFGFYEKKTHKVVSIEKCYIQNEATVEILNTIKKYVDNYNISCFDEKTKQGILRHVSIRTSVITKETMVIFTINGKILPKNDFIIKDLSKIENVKSVFISTNSEVKSSDIGNNPILVYGKLTINDLIHNLTFQISPKSFFQVNQVQTEKLYKKAIELANPDKTDIIIDVFCGIGTLTLLFAQFAKFVYGIEIVNSAIVDAKVNAQINNINNVEFLEGDAKQKIKEVKNATIIVLDPPRKGCDEQTIEALLTILPKKIIYISCDSATLARDLKLICSKYELKNVQPVDCFCMTTHVETIALLEISKLTTTKSL